jgi:hypothetical protein
MMKVSAIAAAFLFAGTLIANAQPVLTPAERNAERFRILDAETKRQKALTAERNAAGLRALDELRCNSALAKLNNLARDTPILGATREDGLKMWSEVKGCEQQQQDAQTLLATMPTAEDIRRAQEEEAALAAHAPMGMLGMLRTEHEGARRTGAPLPPWDQHKAMQPRSWLMDAYLYHAAAEQCAQARMITPDALERAEQALTVIEAKALGWDSKLNERVARMRSIADGMNLHGDYRKCSWSVEVLTGMADDLTSHAN